VTNNWAKWDEAHGHGSGSMTSAERIAAQIRGSLGHGGAAEHKTTEVRGRSGSVISRAEGSRSSAGHVLKKDMKRPAPVKGEKDAADSFRTTIRMAEYKRQKAAATAGDPVDKLTPKNEIHTNPHSPAGLSARAHEATKTAEFAPSVETHHAAAKAHLYASAAAAAAKQFKSAADHQHQAHLHLKEASLEVKHGPTLTPSQLKKLRDAAVSATTHANSEKTEAAHRDAAEAHAKASYAASAMGKPVIAKDHLNAAKKHSTTANEIAKNPTKPGMSSNKIAAAIKSVRSLHKTAHPEPVTHKPGSLEDLANKAEEATAHAQKHPDYNTHKAAADAHTLASKHADHYSKAGSYHTTMAGYHNFAATHPSSVIPAAVVQEHKDEHASKFPAAVHGLFSSFMDTITRRRSQKMYDSVPKASEIGLTPTQKTSILKYTGNGYSVINGHLRGTYKSLDTGLDSKSRLDEHVAKIDAAFDKQPSLADDLITYRGVNHPEKLFGQVGEKVGGEFQDHGYVSTASHASVTSGFGGQTGALIRIIHPKGSKLLKPSDVGAFGDAERELLMPRGSRFHIAADRIVTQHNGVQRRMIDLVRK